MQNIDRAWGSRQTAKSIAGRKTDAAYNRYRIVNDHDIREGMEKIFRAQSNHIPEHRNIAGPLTP
jgi:hypothetical protein